MEKEVDLLIEDPNDVPAVNQNGRAQSDEATEDIPIGDISTSNDKNAKNRADYVNDLLDELDPVKAVHNNNVVDVKLEETSGISNEQFADLLAGGELKFKKRIEIPADQNDLSFKKVCDQKKLQRYIV